MTIDTKIIVFEPTHSSSTKKRIIPFVIVIVIGILLYFVPSRTSLPKDHTISLVISIIVTLFGLVYFLLDRTIKNITINTEKKTIEIVLLNAFGQEKIITQHLDKINIEYFKDNTRSGFNQILVLKDDRDIIKVESNRGFTVEKLIDLKKTIEFYKQE